MCGRTVRIVVVAAAVASVSAFAQAPANAQEDPSLVIKIGTTYAYQGVMVPEGGCQEHVPYEQFAKVSGRVILPETAANVYNFVEYWGRDSGTQVLRIAPNGRGFFYSGGREYAYSLLGPVGTYFDMTDPESGSSLRLVIVGTDITVTLPTGVVYENLTQTNMYCTSCGPDPVRVESRWYSREYPMGVLFRADNPAPCWARWHWLVSITSK